MATIYATGKRKAAIAKVWLTPGNGEMLINGKTLDQWLGGHETLKMKVRLPLEATKQLESMNLEQLHLVVVTQHKQMHLSMVSLKHWLSLNHLSEQSLSLWDFLLVTLELLSVRNQVRKKQEDLHSSQKDSRSFTIYSFCKIFLLQNIYCIFLTLLLHLQNHMYKIQY